LYWSCIDTNLVEPCVVRGRAGDDGDAAGELNGAHAVPSSNASDDDRSRWASICCRRSASFSSACAIASAPPMNRNGGCSTGDGQQRLRELGRVAARLPFMPSQNSRRAALLSA
jgi:hypothetical protein